MHLKTRDVFVFACYTGLSYIDGNYLIFTKRKKNDKAVKIPLLDKALGILKKYDQGIESTDKKPLPVFSNQKINI